MSPAFKIFNFEENFMLGNLDQFSFKVPLAHSPPPMGLCWFTELFHNVVGL